MKTTENISLAGYAFTIESDAYTALETYLSEIQQSLASDSSAEEIIADIEERIAEILSENCKGSMTVNIQMIADIRSRIGEPKEFTEAETDTEAAADNGGNRRKRLYRDIEERVLGGVCSGLGYYFRIDKAIFRIAFTACFLLGLLGADDGIFLIALAVYAGLWIAMPAARTVEQKCELKGKPMHLGSYRAKDFELKKEVKEAVDSPAGKTVRRVGSGIAGILLLIIGLTGLLACIFIPALPDIIRNSLSGEWAHLDQGELLFVKIITGRVFWWIALAVSGLFCIWSIYNGVILTFGLKTPSWKPGLVLFILWVISILSLAAWTLMEVAEVLPVLVN